MRRRKVPSEPQVARVMTFTVPGGAPPELVYSLKTQTKSAFEDQPGFRGLVAMSHPGSGHVIAITLWADRASLDNGTMLADTVVDRIARVTGTIATHDVYEVIGLLDKGR